MEVLLKILIQALETRVQTLGGTAIDLERNGETYAAAVKAHIAAEFSALKVELEKALHDAQEGNQANA